MNGTTAAENNVLLKDLKRKFLFSFCGEVTSKADLNPSHFGALANSWGMGKHLTCLWCGKFLILQYTVQNLLIMFSSLSHLSYKQQIYALYPLWLKDHAISCVSSVFLKYFGSLLNSVFVQLWSFLEVNIWCFCIKGKLCGFLSSFFIRDWNYSGVSSLCRPSNSQLIYNQYNYIQICIYCTVSHWLLASWQNLIILRQWFKQNIW